MPPFYRLFLDASALHNMFDRAERKELSHEPLAWQFVTKEEAAVLAEKTGWNVEPGFTHTMTTEQLWHAVKRHGASGESFAQYSNQIPLTRYVLYCEEVRTGKRELGFKTMYKVKQ